MARGLVKHIMEEKAEKLEKAKQENISLDIFIGNKYDGYLYL